jgi:sodium transport system permease protein
MGPLVLVLLSTLVSDLERRAEARDVVLVGIEHAPTLRNYIERQTWTLVAAPADHEQQLADSKLGDPVLVIGRTSRPTWPPAARRAGGGHSSANQRAQAGHRPRAGSCCAASTRSRPPAPGAARRGAGALEAVQVEERDLADPATRAAQLTRPWCPSSC